MHLELLLILGMLVVNKEIYDRIVKNEMQRAKYNQQLASMDRRQRMISDASVERSRISAGADRYKARLDQGKNMYDSYVDMQSQCVQTYIAA